MTDEKKTAVQPEKDENSNSDFRQTAEKEEAIWDMKQELEDYLEEQGIYIRQQQKRLIGVIHDEPFAVCRKSLYFN